MWKRLTLLLCLIASVASAASVQWNASVVDAGHGTPDGYRVYYGSTSDQLTTVWDNGGSTVFDIPDMWAVGTYYFGVRAYNASGESGWATTPEGKTWVSYVKAEPPPVLPPEPATDVRIVFKQIEEPIMAISYPSRSNSGYDSGPITLNSVAAGSLLVAYIQGAGSLAETTLPAGWVKGSAYSNDPAYGCQWYYLNHGGGNVSVTITDPPGDCGWSIDEFTGVDTSSEPTVSSGATGSGTSSSSGTIAVPDAGSVIVFATGQETAPYTITVDSPATRTTLQSSHVHASGYLIISTSGNYTVSCVVNSGSVAWILPYMVFKPATGGGASAVPAMVHSYRLRRN